MDLLIQEVANVGITLLIAVVTIMLVFKDKENN